ncbi:MAG: oxygenase MpaB family protein [Carbonactinosporaceae bacterium]
MDIPNATTTDPDEGLFGTESVTWRIHGDPVMLLGGLRALLLQALHPRAMAGVAQHSGFRGDPWGRLVRTADYIGAVTYGTSVEAERAGARLRELHARIRVTDPATGRPFRVDRPDLLLWVHCAEVDSMLSVYRRCGGRLTDGEADAYVTEQTTAAALVGLDPANVPTDTAGLAAYFDGVRPELRVTPEARRAARFVLGPPMPRWVALVTPARPAWAGMAGLALAMLPRWARRMYALPGLPTTDLAATITGRALRSGLLALPPAVREGPHRKAARARIGV